MPNGNSNNPSEKPKIKIINTPIGKSNIEIGGTIW
jgi:hypothetical protein